MSRLTGAPYLGRVDAYDADRGLGTVSTADALGDQAAEAHGFHCTAIAGGSRMIAPGTAVAYVLAPGLGGELEARHVTPIGVPTGAER